MTKGRRAKAQTSKQKDLALVCPPHEVDCTQQENCKLGKQQGKEQVNNQDSKPHPIVSQATYADMLAKLAHLPMDE